jgi:hypothetical protein
VLQLLYHLGCEKRDGMKWQFKGDLMNEFRVFLKFLSRFFKGFQRLFKFYKDFLSKFLKFFLFFEVVDRGKELVPALQSAVKDLVIS